MTTSRTPNAPSTPAPIPYGKIHPCPEHKVIREKLSKLEESHERTEGRRWSLIVAAVGSLVAMGVAIITMGLYFGEMASSVEYFEREKLSDRAEIQSLRSEIIDVEREQMSQTQELLRTVTELRAYIEGMQRSIDALEERWPRRRTNRSR